MNLRETFESIIYNGLESLGKYYSSYRGYVIDNDDPLRMNRIKVNVPSVTRHLPHPSWVYPKGGFVGKDYGVQVLPQKGDMVWIEFDHGDTKYPIWSHGHFTKGELPEEFYSPNVYGFKSPKGQVVVIDDENEQIIINHGGNVGLVKVIPLTEKLNNLENKVNDWLFHYQGHIHIDPLSGQTGVIQQPEMGAPNVLPQPDDLELTLQEEIENPEVLH